jgi:hypothetical protein
LHFIRRSCFGGSTRPTLQSPCDFLPIQHVRTCGSKFWSHSSLDHNSRFQSWGQDLKFWRLEIGIKFLRCCFDQRSQKNRVQYKYNRHSIFRLGRIRLTSSHGRNLQGENATTALTNPVGHFPVGFLSAFLLRIAIGAIFLDKTFKGLPIRPIRLLMGK